VAGRTRPAARPPAKKLRSLKVSDAFKRFVLDQLEEIGDVTPRAMFGGVGLYHAGVFFGILASDTLYLKVGDSNLPDYEAAGMAEFNPYPDDSPRHRPGAASRSRPEHRLRSGQAPRLRSGQAPRLRSGRGGTMRYYAVPLDVLESAPELAVWARKAIAVATSA
jgi:TfoX/Sxy family transcriptional regulator of competence genes